MWNWTCIFNHDEHNLREGPHTCERFWVCFFRRKNSRYKPPGNSAASTISTSSTSGGRSSTSTSSSAQRRQHRSGSTNIVLALARWLAVEAPPLLPMNGADLYAPLMHLCCYCTLVLIYCVYSIPMCVTYFVSRTCGTWYVFMLVLEL